LAAALRAHAEGLYCLQAAVGLLIGHQRWLRRDDFLSRFVRLLPAAVGDGVVAVVAWRAAVRAVGASGLSCSDSEAHVLRIAASIAEGVPVDLGVCLSTLDATNIGLVADAVCRAGGRVAAGTGEQGRGDRP
jgi:hypothetical protein